MLAALLLSAWVQQPFDFRVARDTDVLPALREIELRSRQTAEDLVEEVAAFLVREDDGSMRCLLWPRHAGRRFERYDGTIPEGTVAIAHTHPQEWARPSSGDVAESERIGLPIYVLTRLHVYVIDPSSGESVPLIVQKDWTHRPAKRSQCEERWSVEARKRPDAISASGLH